MNRRPPGGAPPDAPGDVHGRLAGRVTELRTVLSRGVDTTAVEALGRLAALFEDESRELSEHLFHRAAMQTDDERREWLWITQLTDEFAGVARQVAMRAADSKGLPAETRAVALANAIVAAGYAVKRRLVAGQPPSVGGLARLHELLRAAHKLHLADCVVTIVACGELFDVSAESLYLRALLLARLSSGTLSGRQIQILDDWLWAWMPALMVAHSFDPDLPSLAVDPEGSQGLTICASGTPLAARNALYFPTAPLFRQLEQAVSWFQQGRIFPGFGLGATFRLEEHLGVIDFLTRELAQIAASTDRRERFAVQAGLTIDVWYGFNDVATRGVRSKFSTDAVARNVLDPVKPSGARSQGFPDAAQFTYADPAKKQVTVRDVSESGLGLVVNQETSKHLAVGDLVAMQLDPTIPVLIGVLTRKAPQADANEILAGIQFLSRRALPLALEHLPDGSARRPAISAVLVPGDHPSGFGDGLIVSESAYRASADFLLKVGDARFIIRLGRIREQGRGWKMAAFSVLVS